jgi:hypothetical protein
MHGAHTTYDVTRQIRLRRRDTQVYEREDDDAERSGRAVRVAAVAAVSCGQAYISVLDDA